MRIIIAFYITAFSILFFIAEPVYATKVADLDTYVKKYNKVTLSRKQLQKLSTYNHLIHYFSNFSFFKPKHKVSPDFIKALILAESSCNPMAVSPKNAIGLGQIILPTGRKAANEIYSSGRKFRYLDVKKLRNLRREDLFDPAINILLTCYLISKYNHRFNGKLDLVVSAWNAGENVDSLKIGLPAPYTETYNLIGKVNGFYLHLLRMRRKT